eukprot:TRINITY_DN30385_c0_g1_i1.p1 TRINITY_DN30385_c0_g1~~TRINITY_DN30385_c0_g1_i1.p1  ORF type:complete len:137 (+),score=34.92 TRINITY_DN30385_c0_g1_i1:117-527(+)
MLEFCLVASDGMPRVVKVYREKGLGKGFFEAVVRMCGRRKADDPSVFMCDGVKIVILPHKDVFIAAGVDAYENELLVLQMLTDIVGVFEEGAREGFCSTTALYYPEKISAVLAEMAPNGSVLGYDITEITKRVVTG